MTKAIVWFGHEVDISPKDSIKTMLKELRDGSFIFVGGPDKIKIVMNDKVVVDEDY